MKTEELKIIIDELIRFGDDKDELYFWLKLYPDLAPYEQMALVKNLQNELSQLQAVLKNSAQ